MMFKWSIAAALLLVGIFLCSGVAADRQDGTIKVDELRLRSGPGTDYRVLGTLARGDRVVVVSRDKGWLEIEHKGRTGFILDRPGYIRVVAPTRQPSGKKPSGLKDSEPNAETIDDRMNQARSQLAKITRKERAALEEFNATDEALNRTRRQVREVKASLAKLGRKIDENRQRSAQLETEIVSGEAYAAKRLVALYKLNWVGRVQLLATADSFFDFINRKEALEKILGQDEALLEALHDKKMALEVLLTQLNAGKAEKQSLELAHKERASQLTVQRDKRQALLRKIRSEKSLELAALESLKQAAIELDVTLKQIEPAAPVAPSPQIQGAENKPFIDYKGLLRWPVKGKIISFFGPYRDKKYAVTNFQSGINIKAERGEPIRSVLDGYTIYASWFKGFGNMMIIDHGNHYYTVYAHLEEVFKVKGDRVDKDEVIATVGDSGSMLGPALHFEVRYHGKPVDPLKWIKKG